MGWKHYGSFTLIASILSLQSGFCFLDKVILFAEKIIPIFIGTSSLPNNSAQNMHLQKLYQKYLDPKNKADGRFLKKNSLPIGNSCWV